MASALCSVARAGEGGMEDAGFWYANAEKLLAPLLFAAATAGACMDDVVRWLDEEETSEVLLALELAGVPEALRAARASLGREERQRARCTRQPRPWWLLSPTRRRQHPPSAATMDPAALVSGSCGSLYCCAPARDQERLAPVFTAIVREVLDAAFERAAATGKPLDPPLLVVLGRGGQRCAACGPRPRRGDRSRPRGPARSPSGRTWRRSSPRYGSRWATVVNNHRAKLVCSGIADPLTLQHVSGLLGDGEKDERSWTIGDDGRADRTEAVTVQPLAPPGLVAPAAPR